MTSPGVLLLPEFDAAERPASSSAAADVKLELQEDQEDQKDREDQEDLEDQEDQEESSELLGGQRQSGHFWTFQYYQSFFDVDTVQVVDRLKGSMVPSPRRNFIKHTLKNNPDLYGPFWICTTLVFSVAFGGNFSVFLSRMGDASFHYRPQFHRVTVAALVIFLYVFLVPVSLWGFLLWRRGGSRPGGGCSFLETVCVYGYSLFVYVPTSVLWIIPSEWLRWALILVAMAISGSVLVLTFWPVVREDTTATAVLTLASIVVLQALLAVGCKLYFFQSSAPGPAAPPAPLHQNLTAHL